MLRLVRTTALAVVVVVATVPALAATASSAPRTTSAASTRLLGVSMLSPTDGWAVGVAFSVTTNTFAQHWDGTTWTSVTTPSPGRRGVDYLQGVSAISASDVWAVGHYDQGGSSHTLIEHWDGTVWTQVPSPSARHRTSSGLDAVTAISADDVWAVGTRGNLGHEVALAEHWDGTSWSIVGINSPGSNGNLSGESGSAGNDVWAVGSSIVDNQRLTLTEHWDGTSWTLLPSVNPSDGNNSLYGVSVSSPDDVWAVGEFHDTFGSPFTPLVEHWDGSTWTQVTDAKAGGQPGLALFGVTSVSPDDVWAVGSTRHGSKALVEHWNGSKWRLVATPGSGASSQLASVSADSATDVHAVGTFFDGASTQALSERWDGTGWSQT